jgi:hypothetical protein
MGLPIAVTEIINAYDTPDIIRIIQEEFWRYDGGRYVPSSDLYLSGCFRRFS